MSAPKPRLARFAVTESRCSPHRQSGLADGCCVRLNIPPERPDLAVYSQEEEFAKGVTPTWDSPDVVVYDANMQILPEASITIRNLEASVKSRLRVRAARHGRSMEEEARVILRGALAKEAPGSTNLFDAICRRVAPFGGVELKIPARTPMREPPELDG